MVLSENFIVGEKAKEKLPGIMESIRQEKRSFSFYCITKPSNESNLMDIHCYAMLFGRYDKYHNSKIIAIALDKEEAIDLVAKMTKEVNEQMQKTGEQDFTKQFRQYLSQF